MSISLACASLIISHIVGAEINPSDSELNVIDVELQSPGLLCGQVVDTAGLPVAGINVEVRKRDLIVGEGVTDGKGVFFVANLRGGIYKVNAGRTVSLVRAWTSGTAPPVSRPGLLVVKNDKIIRGGLGFGNWIANPWVLGGVAAGVIIGALSLDDKGTSTSVPMITPAESPSSS